MATTGVQYCSTLLASAVAGVTLAETRAAGDSTYYFVAATSSFAIHMQHSPALTVKFCKTFALTFAMIMFVLLQHLCLLLWH